MGAFGSDYMLAGVRGVSKILAKYTWGWEVEHLLGQPVRPMLRAIFKYHQKLFDTQSLLKMGVAFTFNARHSQPLLHQIYVQVFVNPPPIATLSGTCPIVLQMNQWLFLKSIFSIFLLSDFSEGLTYSLFAFGNAKIGAFFKKANFSMKKIKKFYSPFIFLPFAPFKG